MNKDAYKYVRFNTAQETRWATRDELMESTTRIDLAADEYPAAGLPLLSDGKVAYVDDSDTHSLIFGSTGSKKTRLFCMPLINILAKAGESFIVTDPKGELYAQTSGLVKSRGYKTVVLNFRDVGQGDMWNPLSLPYELWQAGQQDEAGFLLLDFAATIAERQIRNSKDAFWPEAAQSIAIANLYLMMEAATREQNNLMTLSRLSTYRIAPGLKELAGMMQRDSVPSLNYQNTVCIKADVTVSGMVASLGGMLRVFNTNRKLCSMLSDNSFDMRQIGREKTAVYVIAPDEKTTYHFLITTFIKQSYEILIAEAQKEKNRRLPVRVNYVLDEFCNIPRIPDMPSMISAARSRNMRFYLVAQSQHQLKGRYGEDADTIKGNCDNWIFLSSRELDLLREVSDLCGELTTPDGKPRRLISPSELQRLDKERGEALVMHARQYPIISELADISQYEMFGTHPPVPFADCGMREVETFSLADLLRDIREHKRLAPFASEEHKIAQAKEILNDERNEAFSKEREERGGKGSRPQRGSLLAEAEERARTRIAALLGEDFTEDFLIRFRNGEFENDYDDLDF